MESGFQMLKECISIRRFNIFRELIGFSHLHFGVCLSENLSFQHSLPCHYFLSFAVFVPLCPQFPTIEKVIIKLIINGEISRKRLCEEHFQQNQQPRQRPVSWGKLDSCTVPFSTLGLDLKQREKTPKKVNSGFNQKAFFCQEKNNLNTDFPEEPGNDNSESLLYKWVGCHQCSAIDFSCSKSIKLCRKDWMVKGCDTNTNVVVELVQ